MPDVVSDVVINYKSVGLDGIGREITQLSAGIDGLVVTAENAERATASLENRFKSLERQFGTSSGNAEKFAKVQDTVNKAVAQNPELLGRGNELLAAAAVKYGEAGKAADAYAKAIETARGAALGLAAGIGPVGAILGSFGPWGVAAAAGIGLVSKALDYMNEGANKLGDTAAGLRQFADSTGLTITQVRGLTNVASDMGASSEQFGSALQKLTFNLKDARQGSGDLFTQLRMIDRGLAEQIASAHSTAEALNILGKAYNAATDATQKAAIARAAFGKEGANLGGVLAQIGDEGADGVNKISDALAKATGISEGFLKRNAELRVQIKSLTEENELLMQSIYAQPAQERQLQFLKGQNEILLKTREITDAMAKQNVPMFGDVQAAGGIIPVRTPDLTSKPDTSITDAEIERAETLATATKKATEAKQDYINTTVRQATESSKLVAILGDAATAEERANARIAELTAAMAQDTEHANLYARAIASVRDAYDKSEQAAKGMTSAQSTLGSLMSQNTGRATAYGDANTELSKTQKESADRAAEAAAQARKLAQAQEDAAHAAALLKENLENIQWRQYLLGMSTFAAGMSNFLPMGTGAPGQSSQPDVGTGGFLSGSSTTWRQSGSSSLNPFVSPYGYSGGQDISQSKSFTDMVAAAGAGGVQAALNYAMGQQAREPTYAYSPEGQGAMVQYGVTEQDIISQVTSLYSTLQQQNPAAQAASMQAEMAWLQSRPTSIAQQQAIAQLQQSIQGLTKSTDALNATNQELLSPYYTLDPRTSHIGFRSQGMATGGWVDVPGGYSANDNMIASIPVASGERIFVDPMGSRRTATGPGHTTINISQPILIQGNANKDDLGRTLFQSNQGLAKQINAATAR